MSTHQITEGSVVVGVDGSPSSESALRWAVAEAQRTRQTLHVVHALDNEVVLTDKQQLGTKEAPASSDPVLTTAVDVVRTLAPEVQTVPHSVTGFAATTLVAASKIAGAVVVGSHGRSAIPTVLLGSVSQQVAIHSSCPVVVVRENVSPEGAASGHVVVGVDGSEASGPALAYAFAYAASTGSSLTAVHTWWWEPLEGVSLGEPWIGDWAQIASQEAALVSEVLAGCSEKYPDVPVRSHVVRGDPVVELLDQSHGARLLVVGSRGRGGFIGLLLGSVSRRILKRATGPVAVVRSAGVD
ncbi:MAG TPA: universal stress protein [Dermatophilaceae bacterium]|nr:universal stress protein [Dermatophilaceae bacterium]